MATDPNASTVPEQSESRQFLCAQCGARQRFDPDSGQLICDACGTVEAFAELREESIVEYDLLEGLANSPAKGLGLTLRTVSCQSCGAVVCLGLTETAGSCSFCASPRVLELSAHRQTIRPESLVPFKMNQKTASESFARWLKGLWFRPNDLKKLAAISEIHGVYIPYWVFDARVASRWTARAGYYYYTSETYQANVGGRLETRTRQVQHTRWMPASGSRVDEFDDFLICASAGLPRKLVDKLDSFTTNSLVPYDPSYLAGWRAEEYQLELKPAWTEAVQGMEAIQHNRCAGDVPGDTHSRLQVQNVFSDLRFKHVLLPIWIAGYRYGGQSYQFLVNGQTGEVEGHAPYSVWKIVIAVILGMLILATIAALSACQS